jgi:LytS/YehU family sensor histidine kinase
MLYIIILLFCYPNNLKDPKIISSVAITYVIGFLLTVLIRLVYRKNYDKQKPVFRTFLLIFLISFFASQIWYLLDTILTIIFIQYSDISNLKIMTAEADIIVLRLPVFIAWSGLYFVIKLRNDLIKEKEKAEKADLLAHKAQLQMLRYQLNPHFLFNALNTIRALIEEDKDKAKQIVTELSEFLRYSLVSKNNTMVDFADEVEAIRHYVEIQKIRYEEKLDASIDIQPETEKFQILSFLIYPLVENAVKYGMKTSKLPLCISIIAKISNEFFIVEVINSGKWIKSDSSVNSIDKGTGTGLENVKLRLENAFANNYVFNIKEENDKVIITLQIKHK